MLEKLNKQILLIVFISLLNGQFKDTSIAFDDRLLKSDERSSLFQLENDIKRFNRIMWDIDMRIIFIVPLLR